MNNITLREYMDENNDYLKFYNYLLYKKNQKYKCYYTVDNTDIEVDLNFKEPELKRFFLLELE